MIYIYPYKMASLSATSLRDNFRRNNEVSIKVKHTSRINLRDNLIINWGNSVIPDWYREENPPPFLNNPRAVALASNKLSTLQILEQRNLPRIPYKITPEEAEDYLQNGHIVFARTRLNAHSGGGIVVMKRPEDMVPAPLYTIYIKKRNEFRVHVINNSVILTQEKRAEIDFNRDEDGALIRSHRNGWVFCTENLPTDIDYALLHQIAIDSISALSLDFGAVDIIYNKHHNKFYILEVNTAVGLEGRTLEAYTNVFLQFKRNLLRR